MNVSLLEQLSVGDNRSACTEQQRELEETREEKNEPFVIRNNSQGNIRRWQGEEKKAMLTICFSLMFPEL